MGTNIINQLTLHDRGDCEDIEPRLQINIKLYILPISVIVSLDEFKEQLTVGWGFSRVGPNFILKNDVIGPINSQKKFGPMTSSLSYPTKGRNVRFWHIFEYLPHSPNNTNQLDWSTNVLPKALTKYAFFCFSIVAIGGAGEQNHYWPFSMNFLHI